MRHIQLLLRQLRLELLTVALAVSLIVLAWQTLTGHDRAHLQRMTRLGAIGVQADLVADMQERLRGQTRMAQLWGMAADPVRRDWESSAKLYLDHYPGTLFMEWEDASKRQRWLFPQSANSMLDGLGRVAAAQVKAASATAVAQRRSVMTPIVDLPSGERVSIAVTPVFWQREFRGVIVGAMDVRAALKAMMGDVSDLGYEFVVLEGDKELYAVHGEVRGEAYVVELAAPEVGWTVRVWPGPELLREGKSSVPVLVIVTMGALAAAVLLALRFAKSARQQAQLAKYINDDLTQEVAERRRAEDSARVSEAKFAGILDSSADAIISVGSDQNIVLFNQGAERIFGYRAEEVLGKPLEVLLPGPARALHRGQVAHFAHAAETTMRMCERRPVSGVRKDGTVFPAEATVSKLAINGEVMFTAILRDITERVRTEEALREAHNELENRVRERTAELAEANNHLRKVSGRLLASQEDERRRIARELHDSTSQTLVVAMMNLDNFRQSTNGSDGRANELLSECMQLVEQAAGELRTLSYRLHPPMLEEFGLAFALRWYVHGFSQRIGISIEVSVDPEMGRLERDIEMTVFRIVQEALTNVHRHSHATQASVQLSREPGMLRLEIADNGEGISPDMLSGKDMGLMGVGIAGMKERVYQFRGTLEVHSDADGTKITALFPVEEGKPSAAAPHGSSD